MGADERSSDILQAWERNDGILEIGLLGETAIHCVNQ